MDDLIADFHIHSKCSYDSLMSPEGIVKRAKKVGLTCVAITDHNTIRGGIEGEKYELTYGVEVIVGAEIKTDCGDIIGLNLNDEIGVTGWREVRRWGSGGAQSYYRILIAIIPILKRFHSAWILLRSGMREVLLRQTTG